MSHPLIYLSIPYSFAPDESYAYSCLVTANLLNQGKMVFSPITHNHQLAKKVKQNDHDFWLPYDLFMLEKCDEMLVVVIGERGKELVEQSKGVQAEIAFAIEKNIPWDYLSVPSKKFQLVHGCEGRLV